MFTAPFLVTHSCFQCSSIDSQHLFNKDLILTCTFPLHALLGVTEHPKSTISYCLRLQGTVHTFKVQVTLFSRLNLQHIFVFSADTDYYFVIHAQINLLFFGVLYDYNTIYLGATSVSHIRNILPVSLSFRYRSLKRRDIPAMNSTKLHFLCE